jgi:hypothetical protein
MRGGTGQSVLQMALYKLNSEPVPEVPVSATKGVVPKRRQYRVTPSAQTSIDLVISGRSAEIGVVVTVWRDEDEPATGIDEADEAMSVVCS